MSDVSIVKCDSYEDAGNAIRRSVDLLGGFRKVVKNGDCVVVKPNLVNGARPDTAITTHPSVVVPLVHLAKEAGAGRVVVAENMMWAASARRVFERSGMGEAVRGAGAEVVYLDEDEQVEVNVKGGKLLRKIKLAKTVLDADVFISVPKMKTANYFGLSVMKNLFGLFSIDVRLNLHKSDPVMAMGIMDLLRVVRPKLTIVDGILAGEGNGPVLVDPLRMGVVIAGLDPVAVEAVTAACMGYDPSGIETARQGECEGFGTANMKNINVKGECIDTVKKSFRKPNTALIDRWLGVDAIVGGGCYPGGCNDMIVTMLNIWEKNGKLKKLLKKSGRITFVLGRNVPEPQHGEKNVVIVGDCAVAGRSEGACARGCPPLPGDITAAIDSALGFEKKVTSQSMRKTPRIIHRKTSVGKRIFRRSFNQ